MTAQEVETLVLQLLKEYSYQEPDPGSTMGIPWSSKKVGIHVELLEKSRVSPRIERFKLAETYEQILAGSVDCANYWVIAECGDYLEWYDPETNEFGLGQMAADGERLVSIGVRGDLVGVFCAM